MKKQKKSYLKKSKSPGFLKKFKEEVAMVDYLSSLKILNPASKYEGMMNEPKRKGGFIRLAHAREEFEAPKLTKGKFFESQRKESLRRKKARDKK